MKKRNLFLIIVIILVVIGYNTIGKIYPMDYFDTINTYSKEYGIDPLIVMSLVKAESNFKSDAVSHKSANGLMQITNETASWCAEKMGIDNYKEDMLYDADTNIKMGVFYLDYLLERYDGDLATAVAAYNAGMGNVDKWLSDKSYSIDGVTLIKTPFNETSMYINRIKFNYKMYKLLYGGKING